MNVETTFPRQLKLMQQFTLSNGWYQGCCILPKGHMVFPNYDNNVVNILHINGSKMPSVSFNKKSFDVAAINENNVAVSHTHTCTISIIDVDRSKVINTLKTDHEVWNITHCNDSLIYCIDGKGIGIVNIKTGKSEKVYDDKTVYIDSHIDTDGNRICYTCPAHNKITVLNSDYRVILSINDEDLLYYPQGISIDEHQNMFVCSEYKGIVLLISRDGDNSEILASEDDSLHIPMDVHYDKTKKELLVVYRNCVARKFFVK